jgi:uncharacterized repeat protein (TIGR04052 family)
VRRCAVLLPLLLLPGCWSGPAQEQVVTIRFDAWIGDAPFDCESSTSVAGLLPSDLRFFVHDVRLVNDAGVEVPVTLEQDGRWQTAEVALLDFENGKGRCRNGSPATHDVVTGRVPAGRYQGLRFRIGVPAGANHANPALAKPPLSTTSMHWSWQGGYKFIRFDAQAKGGGGYRIHLGSTGCDGTIGNVSRCARPNRPRADLAGFSPETGTVRVDVARLLAGVDLRKSDAGSHGCMAAADDPGCAPLFRNLGLDLVTGEPTGSAEIFSVR